MRKIKQGLEVSVFAIFIFATFSSSAALANGVTTGTPSAVTSQLQRAASGIEALQGWYDPTSGLYKTTGWWNSANALTVLIDYARVSKLPQYDAVLANTFSAAQKTNPGFLNNYYDDEGWWALAWIDGYDLTGDPRYLTMAEAIFADMTGAWDDTCGGGIWWSKDRKYKNAIANELFFSVAAHLANRAPVTSPGYLDWANKEWKWFAQSGMINSRNLINDGLGLPRGQTEGNVCGNNGGKIWSYNQGVILGGLVELSKLNPDPSLLQTARKIASAAMTSLVDSHGLMTDSCEPHCGADGVQFKGIFVRNLVALDGVDPQQAYKVFIDANSDSIWTRSQGPDFQFGESWSGPFTAGNAGSQSSALDALIAAAALQEKRN